MLHAPRTQYLAPVWAAESLLSHDVFDLTSADLVPEPSCSHGTWFHACRQRDIPVLGFEIDPARAADAARETVAPVLVGEFQTSPLPDVRPTAILRTPPSISTS